MQMATARDRRASVDFDRPVRFVAGLLARSSRQLAGIHHDGQDLRSRRRRGAHRRPLGGGRGLQGRAARIARTPSPTRSSSRRRTSPARCTWATRSTTRCRTSSCRFERMRGKRRAVAAGHRPRRHRHADGGRAPARRSGRADRRELGREEFVEQVWEWKEESGGTIIAPAAAPRRLLRLGARALHHGRGPVARPCSRCSSSSTSRA